MNTDYLITNYLEFLAWLYRFIVIVGIIILFLIMRRDMIRQLDTMTSHILKTENRFTEFLEVTLKKNTDVMIEMASTCASAQERLENLIKRYEKLVEEYKETVSDSNKQTVKKWRNESDTKNKKL